MARSRYLLTLCVLLSGAFLSSCTSTPPATATLNDEQLLQEFRDGKTSLTKLTVVSGYSVAIAEVKAGAETRRLYDSKKWEQLALQVIRLNSGSDLAWFYLGRAAEELGYPTTAAAYFQKSIEESSPKGVSGCLKSTCQGFTFPRDSEARLALLKQK